MGLREVELGSLLRHGAWRHWASCSLRARDHGLGHQFRNHVRPRRSGLGSDLIGVGICFRARQLISDYGSKFLSGSATLIAGSALLALPLMMEPDASALTTMWSWQVIAGWLFLVIFGSLIGYNIYTQLLRDIGPAKAGSFAFVSPAIAVGVGAFLAGESIILLGITGMTLMLMAAGGCLFAEQLTILFSRPRNVKA
jgi:drug/metabolite transporter (DMT)-like permease